MKLYIKEIEFFVKKWYFVTFVLLVTVLGFGFDISTLQLISIPWQVIFTIVLMGR